MIPSCTVFLKSSTAYKHVKQGLQCWNLVCSLSHLLVFLLQSIRITQANLTVFTSILCHNCSKRQVKAKGNAVRSWCSQHLQGMASTNWMCISCQGGNYENCKKQITQNSAMTQNLAAPLFEPFPRSLQSHPPINNASAHLYFPSSQLCNLTMHEIVVLVDTLDQRLKKPKTKWVRRWCKRWAQWQRV